MKVLYQTSTNSVRQKHQQIIKDAFEKAGIQVEIKSIDAGVYFSSDAGNPDTSFGGGGKIDGNGYPVALSA